MSRKPRTKEEYYATYRSVRLGQQDQNAVCPLCGAVIAGYLLPRHQGSKLCQRAQERRGRPEPGRSGASS